ncbi:hypothetical protein BSKO_03468 [Bryopsis sp. KO-2023]|nr:hypothetical protein BSKO_03468 [Bryopsis sp. KO-2023]
MPRYAVQGRQERNQKRNAGGVRFCGRGGIKQPRSDRVQTMESYLSFGRNSPDSGQSSSPIKAIRGPRDIVNPRGEMVCPLTESMAWSSSWHAENEFEKIRVAVKRTETKQLTKDKEEAVRSLQEVQEKLEEKTLETGRLREVNSLVIDRLRKSAALREAALRSLEKKLRAEFDAELDAELAGLRRELALEYRDELADEMATVAECNQKEMAAMRKALQQCRQQAEGLMAEKRELENSLRALQKDVPSIRGDQAVCLMLIPVDSNKKPYQQQEQQKRQQRRCSGAMPESNSSSIEEEIIGRMCVEDEEDDMCDAVVGSSNPVPAEMDFDLIVDEEEAAEHMKQKELEAEREAKKALEKSKGLNKDAPEFKAPDYLTQEFQSPLPSGTQWADVAFDADDARWYAESDEDEVATNWGGEAVEEPAGFEDGWWYQKDQGSFREYRHFQGSSSGNSKKKSRKHSDRSSWKKDSDWSAKNSREFGAVQKVSPGVLVVERKPATNSGSTNSSSSSSKKNPPEAPQCKRFVAGYCRFQTRCWFKHGASK